MNAEDEICGLKIELATVKAELKATASALVLARENRHFMIGLMLTSVLATAGFVISIFSLMRK